MLQRPSLLNCKIRKSNKLAGYVMNYDLSIKGERKLREDQVEIHGVLRTWSSSNELFEIQVS